MQFCDVKHQEICYEGRSCPLCTALCNWTAEAKELDRELRLLAEKIHSVDKWAQTAIEGE